MSQETRPNEINAILESSDELLLESVRSILRSGSFTSRQAQEIGSTFVSHRIDYLLYLGTTLAQIGGPFTVTADRLRDIRLKGEVALADASRGRFALLKSYLPEVSKMMNERSDPMTQLSDEERAQLQEKLVQMAEVMEEEGEFFIIPNPVYKIE